MNNDEMGDDAEFDAFLKGEGDLARRLQAMPQPGPSAELDAAIVGRVRASLAPAGREAANDPADPGPQPARGLGLRWRIPAGIAATVLVGLFAKQSYETSVGAVQMQAPSQERATNVIILQDKAAPPAPQLDPAATAQLEAESRPQPQKPASRMAPQPAMPEQAPAVAAAPPPMPAPVAAAPAPAPAPAAAQSNTTQARMSSKPAADSASLIGSGDSPPAADWIARIETLHNDGDVAAAAREWIRFRERYPEHPVPAAFEAKMKSISD